MHPPRPLPSPSPGLDLNQEDTLCLDTLPGVAVPTLEVVVVPSEAQLLPLVPRMLQNSNNFSRGVLIESLSLLVA